MQHAIQSDSFLLYYRRDQAVAREGFATRAEALARAFTLMGDVRCRDFQLVREDGALLARDRQLRENRRNLRLF